MAYGTKYQIAWKNEAGENYLYIQQQGYSGSAETIRPAASPFELEWGGKETDDLNKPLIVSTAKIRFLGDSAGSQLEEVFDSGDREWRVRHEIGGSLNWQGYLTTDLWKDNPDLGNEVVELEAVDGLVLLENDTFDPDWSSDNLYSIARSLIREAQPLEVASNMEWYAFRSTGQISASKLPLSVYEVGDQAFDDLESIEGRDEFRSTGSRNKKEVLEAIVERFGMQLFQNGGRWVMRQRHRIQLDGTIKMWENESDALNGSPSTKDLTQPLPFVTDDKTRPRSRVQRLRKTSSSHNYSELGELVKNNGFEGPNGNGSFENWTTTAPGGTVSKIVEYDNTPLSRNSTQENQYAALLDTPDTGENMPSIKQNLNAVIHDIGPRGAFQFTWEMAMGSVDAADTPFVQFIVEREGKENAYIDAKRTDVTKEADAADDGKLFVKPIVGSKDQVVIPKDATLPIYQFDTGEPLVAGTITLSQPAYGQDEVLKGSISDKVKTDSNQRVGYWYWAIGKTESDPFTGDPIGAYLYEPEDFPNKPESKEVLQEQSIVVPQRDPDGQEVITGRLSMEMSLQYSLSIKNKIWYDNVSAKFSLEGDDVDSTKYIALDDQSGRDQSIKHLIGDGPRFGHPKAIKLEFSNVVTGDWKNGPYNSGENPSGKGLEEITAKTIMRQQRDTLSRKTYTLSFEDEVLYPEHVIEEDGKLYTINYLRRTYGSGNNNNGEVQLSEIKDAGTSGLTRAFYQMESGGGTSGSVSGGGGTGGGSLSGGGTSGIWGEITDKPSDLFARSGGSDGYASTVPLESNDINSALNNEVKLNFNLGDNESPTEDGRLRINRGSAIDALLEWDETNEEWKIGKKGNLVPVGSGKNFQTGDGLLLDDSTSPDTLQVDSTVARTDADETFSSNVTVQGDLTVNGTEFITNTETVEIQDNLAVINNGESGSGVSEGFAGWEVDRGSLTDYFFGFDEDRERFVVGKGTAGRQVVATREDSPFTSGLTYWDGGNNRLATSSDLTFDGSTVEAPEYRTTDASTGFTGSGSIVAQTESWFDDVQIRGSLFAREFEIRKIEVSKGTRFFSPGGGKIQSIDYQDSSQATFTFAEEPGITLDDYLLVKEVNASDGSIAVEIRMSVNSKSGKQVTASFISRDRPLEAGDDVVVIGSNNTSRDSFISANPFIPAISTVDNINGFGDWDNRTPNARFGDISGMPSIGGFSPSGSGLWGNNVYLEGTIVANKGKIKDSVTIGSTTAGEVISATEAQNKVDSLEDTIYGQTTDEGTTLIDGGTIVTNLINTDQIAVSDLSDGSDYAKLSEAQSKVDALEDTIYGQSSDEGTTLINGGQIVTSLIAADEIAVGDLSDGGNYATLTQAQNKADDAESSAESYADGLDQSVRNDLQTTFENAVANGNTIIDGGVIATDLVTTDSLAFTPTDSSNIVGTINASTEGININADKLKINSNTTFANNYDPSTKAELSDIPDSSVTIRDNSKPSSRPDGSSLEDGDIWIDTDNGNRPHVYDGTNDNWDRQYTAIDGGNILTSTIQADSLSVIETNLGSVNINENINMEDDGSILMGSGVDRFLLGDFDIDFVNNSKNGSIDMSGTNADVTVFANGSSQTNTGSAEDFIGNIGGYLVDVNVGYEFSNSDNGGNRFDRDFMTSHSITLTVKFKNGTNVLKTVDKRVVATNAIADETGTATLSGSAPSGTDTIELEAECSAQLGSNEGFYTSIGASVQDSNVNVTAEGSKDFVGGQGIRYTDQGNDILRLDATDMSHDSDPDSYKNEARIRTRGGMIVIEDENGTEQIRIHPQGYIDFRAQGGSFGNINGNDFPEPPSPWVRMGAESNNKKLARKSWDGGANDF